MPQSARDPISSRLRRIEREPGVDDDGVLGPATLFALEARLTDRKQIQADWSGEISDADLAALLIAQGVTGPNARTPAKSLSKVVIPYDAQNNYTNSYYPVGKLVFFSKTEPVYPSWAGFVEVTFDAPITWAVSTGCSTTAAVIRNEDNHLISAIQTALALNRSVRLFVDDSQTVGNVCILRAIQY